MDKIKIIRSFIPDGWEMPLGWKQLIDSLSNDEAKTDEPAWARGFRAGVASVYRKNPSGCACLFNEAEEIVSLCFAHKEFFIEQKLNEKED